MRWWRLDPRPLPPADANATAARRPNIAAAPLIEVIDTEYNRGADDGDDTAAAGGGEGREGATAGAGAAVGAGAGAGAGARVGADLVDAMSALALGPPKYGFNNAKSGVFRNLGEETVLTLELPQPDKTPASQRHGTRARRASAVQGSVADVHAVALSTIAVAARAVMYALLPCTPPRRRAASSARGVGVRWRSVPG